MVKRFIPFLLISSSAFGISESDWSTKIWGNHLQTITTSSIEETQTNAGLFFSASTKPSEQTYIKAELISYYIRSRFLDVADKDLESGELFNEVNELSLAYSSYGFRVKAGQQITAWGKADGLNPTDFLTGRRNLLLVPDSELTRRGHGSLMIEWVPNGGSSPWSFQQWIVPLHSKTDVLLNRELTQNAVKLDREGRTTRVEMATKIGFAGQGWDLDYTYFNGVSKTPVFTESARILMPFHLTLRPNYTHQEGHGVNFSMDLIWSVIRFEAAYHKRNEVLENADYITDPTRIDLVAGFEKSFLEDHRLNIQGVAHYYPSYNLAFTTDPVTQSVQNLNKIILAQHLQTRFGYLFVYNFEPSSYNQLKLRFSLLNYFHKETATLFFPSIDYLLNDNLKLQAYAMIFRGGTETPFGVLKELSSLAIGANYQF